MIILLSIWIGALKDQGKSAHTVRAYENDVRAFWDFVKLHRGGESVSTITLPDLRSWLASRHRDGLNPRSIARALAALRHYWAFQKEQDPSTPDFPDLLGRPRLPKTLPRPITEAQAQNVLEYANNLPEEPWIGARDQALFTLIYSVGLRIQEALNLRWEDIQGPPLYLRILGKGQKARDVPFILPVQEVLHRYKHLCPFPLNGPLFYGLRGGALLASVARVQIQRLRHHLNLPKSFTPHALRHSCATHLLNRSSQVRSIQDLLGHQHLASTQIYTEISNDQLKQGTQTFHPRANKSENITST